MDRSRSTVGRYGAALRAAIASDWPIYLAAALYVACGYLYVTAHGATPLGILRTYATTWTINFVIMAPFIVMVCGIAHITHRLDKRRRLAYRAMFAPRRLARFVAGTLLMLSAALLFTSMFSSVKSILPLASGFQFDVAQADIDKAIHFGVDPWRLLYAVAQHPLVLRIVEINYNALWFVICYGTFYWVVTSPRAEGIRVRYVLTWFISWIVVGNLMAGYWISAGPVYYGHITGDTARFGEQLAFLATSSGQFSAAHDFQAYLWRLHESGTPGIGSGISAFPSMHIALISLNALFAGEVSRRLGLVLWAYAAFVLASSVYLGWHYAIDGYVSAVVVTALYWALKAGLPVLARLRWRAGSASAVAAAAQKILKTP